MTTTYGFNELEALRIAIEIERAGERHFRACRRFAFDSAAKTLLERLEREEAAHATHFERMFKECEARGAGGDEAAPFDRETAQYLSAIAAGLVFPGGVVGETKGSAPITVGRVLLTAIEAEKSSLLYYQALLEHSPYMRERDTFEHVIKEERHHLIGLTDMLARAEGGVLQ